MVEVTLFVPSGLIGNHRRQGHYSQGPGEYEQARDYDRHTQASLQVR